MLFSLRTSICEILIAFVHRMHLAALTAILNQTITTSPVDYCNTVLCGLYTNSIWFRIQLLVLLPELLP